MLIHRLLETKITFLPAHQWHVCWKHLTAKQMWKRCIFTAWLGCWKEGRFGSGLCSRQEVWCRHHLDSLRQRPHQGLWWRKSLAGWNQASILWCARAGDKIKGVKKHQKSHSKLRVCDSPNAHKARVPQFLPWEIQQDIIYPSPCLQRRCPPHPRHGESSLQTSQLLPLPSTNFRKLFKPPYACFNCICLTR